MWIKSKQIYAILLAVVLLNSCSVYTKPQKVDDYLYSIDFSDYDFDKLAKKADDLFYGKKKLPRPPACSAIRCDSLLGRNFDWLYDEMPEFVISVNAKEGRYASLGIASPIAILKEKKINSLWGKYVIDKLPLFTVDGINEKGVACCVNVVPQGDCGYMTGTNPGKPKLYAALFVRYVLDYAASAREAIDLLNSRNFYSSKAFGMIYDFHFMIADSSDTYIVEFVDNKPVVLENNMIMTNFYISAGTTPHAMGLERYDILQKEYSQGSTEDGMFELLEKVWYSDFYKNKQPLWLSELCHDSYEYGLTTSDINQAPEKFVKPYEEVMTWFKERNRKKAKTCQSVHTSIYNLDSKTLSVSCQESERKHIFKLK